MGLDQYLYANKYVSRKDFNRHTEDGYATNQTFNDIVSLLDAESIVDNEWSGMQVMLPVGYWRKANAIHSWIVDNCADGIDECQRIFVSQDKAIELVSLCKRVLEDNSLALALLPPQSGFFFGSLDIDEYYIWDLQHTIEVFEKLLADPELAESIIYQASW